MRPITIVGLILIVLGVLSLFVHSFTFFTTERETGPLGFFTWEVSEPQTFFIHPVVGIFTIAIGIALALFARRKHSA